MTDWPWNRSESEQPDDAVERAFAAMRDEPAADGPSVELVADTLAAVERAAVNYERPIPLMRRILTVKNLTISAGVLSAAAVLLIVVLAPSSVTFADAVKCIREAHTLSYTLTVTFSQHPDSAQTEKVYCRDNGRSRIEYQDGMIAVADGKNNAILLDPKKKQATYNLTFGFMFFPDTGPVSDWIRWITKKVDKPTKELGERNLDGKQVKGFVGSEGSQTWTIWIDKASAQPVLVDVSSPQGDNGYVKMQISDIRINPDIDDSMFSMEVPPGYTVRQPTKPEDKVDLRIVTKKDAQGREYREYQLHSHSKSEDSPKK